MTETKFKVPALQAALPVRQFLQWAVIITLAVSVLGVFLATILIKEREAALLVENTARTELQAATRAQQFGEWLSGVRALGQQLTEADLVRLYITERTLAADTQDEQTREALLAQTPYMQQAVRDFVAVHALERAYLLDEQGQLLVGSDSTAILPLNGHLERAVSEQQTTMVPIRESERGLIQGVIMPIKLLADGLPDAKTVGVLYYEMRVNEKMRDLLARGLFDETGENAYLLQRGQDLDMQLVTPTTVSSISARGAYSSHNPVRASKVGVYNVFSSIAAVGGSPFYVLHEYRAEDALLPLAIYARSIYSLVLLGAGVVIAVSLAGVAYLLGQRNRVRVNLQGQTISALVRATEIRDPYLAGHYNRVSRLAVTLGNVLGLSVKSRSTLYYAGQLAGIGKIFVPQDILNKPGKLTAKERQQMESHVEHALNVLNDVEFALPVGKVIHQMYERRDGSGYPQGLKGDSIDQLSSLLGLADMFCALTHPRAYREAQPIDQALDVVAKVSDQFDTDAVEALQKLYAEVIAAPKAA